MAGARARREHSLGVGLTLISAVAFGTTGVLAKGAYGAGASVPVVLGGRFALAALLLWVLVALRRPAFPPAGVMAAAFALGAFGYAGEAFLYFSALERLDASLVTLLLATYPVLVVGAAIALGRERPDRRRAVALLAAVGGAALVLGGAQAGALSGLGLLLAASATVAYATYVLLADRVVRHADGLLLAALVISGAAAGMLALGGLSGGLGTAGIATDGWLAIAGLAVACTVVPIAAFLLALPRIGPGTASILSTFEVVVGVGLAALLLGESLGPLQLLGTGLVLAAVVTLQLRPADRVAGDEPAAAPAAPAAAGQVAHQPA
ncbi:MAG: DMT family transporter [Solirubrobacteraceae bacterium]|nr:DMT family transporter [Solirubrobacteraceae bacterium]